MKYLECGSLLDVEVPAALGLPVLVLGLAGVLAAVAPGIIIISIFSII